MRLTAIQFVVVSGVLSVLVGHILIELSRLSDIVLDIKMLLKLQNRKKRMAV